MTYTAKHTIAPWIVRRSSSDAPAATRWLCDGLGKHFMNIRVVREMSETEIQANFAMLAAAPEMFDAITAILREFDAGTDFLAWEAAKSALREAHAKAVQS